MNENEKNKCVAWNVAMGITLLEPTHLFSLYSHSQQGPMPAIRDDFLHNNCALENVHKMVAHLISEVDMDVEFDPPFNLEGALAVAQQTTYPFVLFVLFKMYVDNSKYGRHYEMLLFSLFTQQLDLIAYFWRNGFDQLVMTLFISRLAQSLRTVCRSVLVCGLYT